MSKSLGKTQKAFFFWVDRSLFFFQKKRRGDQEIGGSNPSGLITAFFVLSSNLRFLGKDKNLGKNESGKALFEKRFAPHQELGESKG